jgi:protein SCO1
MGSSRFFRTIVSLFAIAVAAVIGVGIFTLTQSDDSLRGATGAPPRDVSNVRMTDVNGSEISFTPTKGNVTLAYFGYTSCPDVCPTTLSDIRTAMSTLGTKSNRVKVDMVTIDPTRDSGPVLHDYLGRFFPEGTGIALRTDDETKLHQVATSFGASYQVTPATKAGDQPDVLHSSWLYAVDDTGHIVAQWSFGTPSKDIAHDLKVLLA